MHRSSPKTQGDQSIFPSSLLLCMQGKPKHCPYCLWWHSRSASNMLSKAVCIFFQFRFTQSWVSFWVSYELRNSKQNSAGTLFSWFMVEGMQNQRQTSFPLKTNLFQVWNKFSLDQNLALRFSIIFSESNLIFLIFF